MSEKQGFCLRARRQKRCYAAHSEAFVNAVIVKKAALQPVAHTVFQLLKKSLIFAMTDKVEWGICRRLWGILQNRLDSKILNKR